MGRLDQLKKAVRKCLRADPGSHGWDHAERVQKLCRHIGNAEGADLQILDLAAYLHDICRAEEKASGGTVCHAHLGAERAGRLLQELGYDSETVRRVSQCIASHRFRGNGVKPDSLEARVLFDADKLDAIGAVGIGRAFVFAAEVGARLHNPEIDVMTTPAYSREDTAFREFSVKLRKVKEQMLTSTGRKMAERRHDFMLAFFERLTREALGEE